MEGDSVPGRAEYCKGSISIHALRVEGDRARSSTTRPLRNFYPRPPGGGRPCDPARPSPRKAHFYPRPPGGGRPKFVIKSPAILDFYPRPPGGGRHVSWRKFYLFAPFLSTPSGWRATKSWRHRLEVAQFLSTPSGWRATPDVLWALKFHLISIHALRVEGDAELPVMPDLSDFISIHALRVEGDAEMPAAEPFRHGISIHALRVEGDESKHYKGRARYRFLSTPSGWRATSLHF